jgi:hypothetical protein
MIIVEVMRNFRGFWVQGNEDNPMEAPEEEIKKFSYIENKKRRILAGRIESLLLKLSEILTFTFSYGLKTRRERWKNCRISARQKHARKYGDW